MTTICSGAASSVATACGTLESEKRLRPRANQRRLDATLPAADVFRTGGTLAEAAAAARRGADSTASLAATHGRSAYLAEETQRGVVDPGARAVAIAFAAVASA